MNSVWIKAFEDGCDESEAFEIIIPVFSYEAAEAFIQILDRYYCLEENQTKNILTFTIGERQDVAVQPRGLIDWGIN